MKIKSFREGMNCTTGWTDPELIVTAEAIREQIKKGLCDPDQEQWAKWVQVTWPNGAELNLKNLMTALEVGFQLHVCAVDLCLDETERRIYYELQFPVFDLFRHAPNHGYYRALVFFPKFIKVMMKHLREEKHEQSD